MSAGEFQVIVPGYRSTISEWKRAQGAPVSELKIEELSAEQKAVAQRMGVSVENYARGVLAGRYGKKRMEDQGRALGRLVSQILSDAGTRSSVLTVSWEIDRLRWMVRVETPSRVVGVPVSLELVEDAVDSSVLSEIERLRIIVLEGIGREDLVARKAG